MIARLTKDQIAAAITPATPSLEQLETLVNCAKQRCSRAADKFRAAQRELIAARMQHCHVKAKRTEFIAAQHDDQMRLL